MHAVEKIRFSRMLSPEVRSVIEPHLAKWAFLIPGWCHEVTIIWDDDDDDGALRINVFYEYRTADIAVLANFMTKPEYREGHVVHELLHLSLAPLTQTAQALRDALTKKIPDVEDWATEMIRQGEEASTCDLTALVIGQLAIVRPEGFMETV